MHLCTNENVRVIAWDGCQFFYTIIGKILSCQPSLTAKQSNFIHFDLKIVHFVIFDLFPLSYAEYNGVFIFHLLFVCAVCRELCNAICCSFSSKFRICSDTELIWNHYFYMPALLVTIVLGKGKITPESSSASFFDAHHLIRMTKHVNMPTMDVCNNPRGFIGIGQGNTGTQGGFEQ